ncbi:MAG: hypothetical protein LBN95_06350 [Prevotellaceae bacterium]|nr:hypothetical protein [Prevotellaceae bacterium]
MTEGSDTTFWLNYNSKKINILNLISPNSNENFIRISGSSANFALELSEKSNKIYFYTYAGKCNTKNKSEKFIKIFELTDKQIKEIRLLIDTLNINGISSDKFIENWEKGFDGISYLIEIKQDNNYSFKHYWSPHFQKNCNEAIIIQNFINELNKIIDYQNCRKKFISEIPFDCYSIGMIYTIKAKKHKKR